ncbi:MAG TPA: hypothetical protein DCX14_12550 [Flavobacteriales bacterium]|jgi:hypothetical protein|nr:hypothetical protein [Flavobacteriales bacterium]HAW21004.1 hypothetical protein [Flavobacteriales bacterium]
MHTIEPYWNWRNLYAAELDEQSPFYGREYSETFYTDAIYDHYIHPQWDNIGSATLFIKILYVEYEDQFAIIELIGEWNDTLNNDIMTLKRDIIDALIDAGINKFIIVGESVMNFHSSDDCYYEEWFEDVEDGWIAALNFRQHVLNDFTSTGIDNYLIYGGALNDFEWTTFRPLQLFQKIEKMVEKRFDPGFMLAE